MYSFGDSAVGFIALWPCFQLAGQTSPCSYAERFVRTIKEDCLDRMILFGEQSLRNSVQHFSAHYHFERNHQGLDNRIITLDQMIGHTTGTIRRRQRLGGLLGYYYREAA
jgi:hypothetical protein